MRIKKPKTLTKKTLGPPRIEWRQPFDDKRSPFRISFGENDPSRGGMKLVRVQKVDGSLAERIVVETMADALAGNPPAQMVADCRKHLERCQRMSDCEIASALKDVAETLAGGILYIDANPINRALANDPAAHTVFCLRLSYARTLTLLLWLCHNPDVPWRLDGAADWSVSGYQLFHAGILDECCQFTPGALNPTPEDIEDFPEMFGGRDRMPQGASVDNMAVNARHIVLCSYLDLLQEAADHPAIDAPASFAPCLAHSILFTERWFAKQMAEAISHETGEIAHVVKINTETGEVQPVLGDEAAADHIVAMGFEYFGALTDGLVQQRPEGIQ
jgi:hypothetical protein